METITEDYVLTVEGLRKTYGKLVAVDDLSLGVRRGEIFALLDPNGAGKTTAISMICGLIPAGAGVLTIDGCTLASDPARYKQSIGLCPQDLIIWESLTCLEQLEIMGQLYDLSPPVARRKALELLAVMGLEERKNSLAKTLSGGMKRRLNIALALVHDPVLLILDEPQAGLDPQSRILVREYIRSLKPRMTVILTTHDMDEADRLADRVAIIDHGKLLIVDTPARLKDRAGEGDILEISIVGANEEQVNLLRKDLPPKFGGLTYREGILRLTGVNIPCLLPELLADLERRNLEIGEVSIRNKSLEDVFIALTGRKLRE